MQRKAIFSITVLVLTALVAQPAAAGNCVNKTTRGGAKDWVCTVVSDFDTRFRDCLTFERVDRDNFMLNVAGLTPFFVLGGCNDEGSLTNPRFGRSLEWMATFGFFDAPFSITFAGGEAVDGKPAQFAGRASNEFGDRFYMRCKPDKRDVCPLVAISTAGRPAGESNWKRPGR